ncbi:MAG TPA: hypothetical protein VIK19_03620 [Syntrophales bacterium]
MKKDMTINISCKDELLQINCEFGTVVAQCTCKEESGLQRKEVRRTKNNDRLIIELKGERL